MKNHEEQAVRQSYAELTQRLIEKHCTITTMESCTGGQIASLISDTQGASGIMKGAFVAYSDEAKLRLGVPGEILDRYSAYSPQTAQAMAQACARYYQADIGIGVTGTLGNPDPAHPEVSCPGQVWFCLCIHGQCHGYALQLTPQATRLADKLAVAGAVAETLHSLL